MNKIILITTVLTIGLADMCEDLLTSTPALTTDEVVKGLKTALSLGTDKAVSLTSLTDGYYKDKLIKIGLPKEADLIMKYINKIPGGSGMVENVVKSINRSAEEAAKEAAPIFKNAITGMSISDGWSLLNGKDPSNTSSSSFDSIAATSFLKNKTYNNLVSLYAPKINSALGKDLGLGFTATSAWNDLTGAYNKYVVPVAGILDPSIKAINTDIGSYCTQKALDGLFYKVGLQEKNIRKDPYKWASDIIKKVFGSVYNSKSATSTTTTKSTSTTTTKSTPATTTKSPTTTKTKTSTSNPTTTPTSTPTKINRH